MSEVKKALIYSALNKYLLQLISFFTIVVLSRLLTPEETGTFAVVSSLAFVATSLRTFGVGEFLMREKAIDTQVVRSVTGVMVLMSWSLGAFFLGVAPWVAGFYSTPVLADLLMIASIPFFLSPMVSIPFSLLARSMSFDKILKVELCGSLARNGGSIGLVLLGYSYYGLAWGMAAGVFVQFLVISFYRPEYMDWLPSFRNMGRIFSAGMKISISNMFLMSSKNSNDLVLGRMASMGDVGIFSRGLGLVYFLNDMVVKAVGPVALPHLSKVKRDGGDVAQAYLKATALIGAVALPMFAVVTLTSHAMVVGLFGPQWVFSAELASILAIWAMTQCLHCFAKQGLLTVKRDTFFLIKEAQSFFVKILLIILVAPSGLVAVAWAVAVSGVIDLIVASYLLKLALGIKFREMLASYLPNFEVAGLCWISLYLLKSLVALDEMNEWLSLLITVLTMLPVWLFALKITHNPLWPYLVPVLRKLRLPVR
jgi:O-antigen/teichoic acid export membrane protein